MASLMFYPLLLFAVFWIGGNAANILLAFQDMSIDGSTSWVGLKNFREFITDIFSGDSGIVLRISFWNSLKSFALRFLISNPLYFLFSYYIFKNYFGHRAMRAIMMIPQVLSMFLIALVFQKFVEGALPGFFEQFGISLPKFFTDGRYAFGTMIFFQIWISFATSLILYPNAMKAIPEEIFESASLDGITAWREFWNIIFPLIFPTVSTLIVTGVATIFTDGGPVLIFYGLSGAPYEAYNIGYYFYTDVMTATNTTRYPYLAAGGLFLTVMSVPLTFLLKFILEKYTPDVEY